MMKGFYFLGFLTSLATASPDLTESVGCSKDALVSSGFTKRTGAFTGPFLEGLRLLEPVHAGLLARRFNQ